MSFTGYLSLDQNFYCTKRKKLILVGDYNIVHKELDIHNPQRKDNPSGYRPEERAWLDAVGIMNCLMIVFESFFQIFKRLAGGVIALDHIIRIKVGGSIIQSISKPFGNLVKGL